MQKVTPIIINSKKLENLDFKNQFKPKKCSQSTILIRNVENTRKVEGKKMSLVSSYSGKRTKSLESNQG